MLPTFVFGWPTGKEKGSYLAVDLGGTNLRVCHVELEGEGRFEVTQTKYRLLVLTFTILVQQPTYDS
jgi:hexokinase